MINRGKKRTLALVMTLALLVGLLPTAALATGEGPPCDNHPEHTADCGYVEAVEGPSDPEPPIDISQGLDLNSTPPKTDAPATDGEGGTALEAPAAEDNTITGGGYTFDKTTGTLTISADYATTTWREDTSIPKEDVITVVIESGVTEIRVQAFLDCSAMTSITIPEGVTQIGLQAFSDCRSLTSILLPKSLEKFGAADNYFASCNALTQIEVAEGSNYFSDIDGVLFNQDGTVLLFYPKGRRGPYAIPAGVKEIHDNAFSYRYADLTAVTFPNGLEKIGSKSFMNTSLAAVALPDSLKEIGERAFSLNQFASITIPENVTKIGDFAFQRVPLKVLFMERDVPPEIGANTFETIDVGHLAIYVPAGTEKTYRTADNWVRFTAQIMQLPTYLFDGDTGALVISATEGATLWRDDVDPSDVRSVTVAARVTSLPDGVFKDCTSLTQVSLPDTLTSIGGKAFSGCSALTSLTLPESLTTIGRNTFSGCSALTSLTLPEGLTTIGDTAFWNCSSLREVSLPKSLTTLGWAPFQGCDRLETITVAEGGHFTFRDGLLSGGGTLYFCAYTLAGTLTIPEGITALEENLLNGRNNITALSLPASLTAWSSLLGLATGLEAITVAEGNSHFRSLDGVLFTHDQKELLCFPFARDGAYTVPEGVERLGENAFAHSQVAAVTLPESLTSLGGSVFQGCVNLTEIRVPQGVASLPPFAFALCPRLERVTLPAGLTEVGPFAFIGCLGLTEVGLPSGLQTVGDGAFTLNTTLTSVQFQGATAPALGPLAFCNDPEAPLDESDPTKTLMTNIADLWLYDSALRAIFQPIYGSLTATPSPTLKVPAGGSGYSGGEWDNYTLTTYASGGGGDGGDGGGGGSTSSGGSDRDDRPSATDKAVSKIEKAKDGDTVKVDLPSNGKVPGKVLEAAAGKDITLEIDAGSGITWVINGKDIPSGKLSDLNLKVNAKANTIPVTVINALTGEEKVMQLTLSHNGEFPFPLTLRLDAGKENAGLFANLYYYNETAKELEYQSTAEIDADGNAHIPFAHASSYAVVIDATSHAPVVWENPFTDVGTTDWFYGAVEYVHQTGLMVGTTDTTFGPSGAVTRAQVWTVLARMSGADTSGGAPWYAPAQAWAVANGVSDGTNPDGAVTREQLVTMLWRYAQSADMDVSVGEDTNILSYDDAFDVAEWAIPAFQWACGAGVVSGTGETTLSPQAGATRAQLAAILQRFSSGTI